MEVNQSFDLFVEKDGDVEFRFMKIIICGPNRDFYYAITEDRVRIPFTIDLEKLNKIPIDTDTIWSRYSARLLQAPSPVQQDSYPKETDLCHNRDWLLEPGHHNIHDKTINDARMRTQQHRYNEFLL
ncbi:hypothetical protein E4U56_005274 [Claviceps arundinis]|uniref:Uncharacterized protein n=1 Tax=Claviceps arundinis TaxID=1623583 RepID=A0A9P7MME2_9HYPO|nr:hypothetical protein E4U56_005274 [Claviceps arundinis]